MPSKFHHIARAILLQKGQVLIAQAKGWEHTFLPGGHIEIGESAADTLVREWQEEAALNVRVGRFVGNVEGDWVQEEKGIHHFEITQVFTVECDEVTAGTDPAASEEHLTFFWIPATLAAMEEHHLLPIAMREAVLHVAAGKREAFWASSLLR